jgi:PAS domain S-box-containing protein
MNVIEKMLAEDAPTITADSEGLITEVNAQFLETYEWKESALIGEPLTIIIPGKFHDAHNLSFSRFLHTGISSIFSQWVPLEIVDGKAFYCCVRNAPGDFPRRPYRTRRLIGSINRKGLYF